ncbi:MAG: hypothetical protein LC659_13680 [Myxococcales bacterium]|nr:hypothetical protein [Myxococcales bacterium]
MNRYLCLAGVAALAACAPRQISNRPIILNGDRVGGADAAVQRAATVAAGQGTIGAQRDSIAAVASAGCAPTVCAALARGEVALGMNETQLLAATRTTPLAWTTRHAGSATVLVASSADNVPRDAAGALAMVQLDGDRVTSYSYREAHGVRVVSTAADATTAGRARATADVLVREGDDLVASGDMALALDRYDRASVLVPDDAALDYRIATLLDKQLRPIEALVRYQLFLHKLEIEKINAIGDANAKLADAIARAQQRVIILERQTR